MIRKIVRKSFPRQWELIKEKKSSDDRDCILKYTGNRANRDYVFERFFGGAGQIRSRGRRWNWLNDFRFFGSRSESRISMTEVSQDHGQHAANSKTIFYIPQWISATLDISVGLPELLKKESLRSDVRKLKKNNLSFRISTDTSEFSKFYHDMYVPHVSAAHGTATVIVDYQRALSELDHSDLLLVLYEQTPIAGAMIVNDKDQSKIWLLGVRQPGSKSIRLGALSAAYYFSVEHLLQKGVTQLDLGLSRPFLSDGVLNYKRKWNPEISVSVPRGWLLKIPQTWEGALTILTANPFIQIKDNEPWVSMFIEDFGTVEKTKLRRQIPKQAIDGISGVQVLDSKGVSESYPIGCEMTV